MSLLYHYTNINGLLGILRPQDRDIKLWLRRFTKGYYIKQPNMDCQPTEITALMRHRAVFS